MSEVAGLTITELNDALKLKDRTLLEAVENGTATLSFELILRLAALLARNDPIPFILKYTRTYNPKYGRYCTIGDWGEFHYTSSARENSLTSTVPMMKHENSRMKGLIRCLNLPESI